MDELAMFECNGLSFLCDSEQLASGIFKPRVRFKAPPSEQMRTLHTEAGPHTTALAALQHAERLAREWAQARLGDGRGES